MKDSRGGTSPSGNHYLFGSDDQFLSCVPVDGSEDLETAVVQGRLFDLKVGLNFHVLPQNGLGKGRHFGFLFREELGISADYRYSRSHGGEEVTELCSDVPATNDGDALRQDLHPERSIAGKIAHPVQPPDGGDYRLRTNAQENRLRCYCLASNLQGVRGDEFCHSLEVVDVLGAGKPPPNGVDVRVDQLSHPRHDLLEVCPFELDIDSQLACFLD